MLHRLLMSHVSRTRIVEPIVLKEKLILVVAVLQTGFAIWGMGLIFEWAQFTFLALSVLGMALTLWTQTGDPRRQDPAQTSRAAWKRLRHFPLFWLSLMPLLYIAAQGLNPAFGYEETPETWRSFPIDHLSWLPSGVDGPFYKINAWRLLLMFSGVGLFVAYLQVGLLRRRLWLILAWSIVVQGVLYAILAYVQIQTHAQLVYWMFDDQTPLGANFLGSIPYYNRGAAAVNLMMGVSMALYFYHLRSMRRRLQKSGPHLLLLPIVFMLYGTLWLSSSRAGIVLGSAMVGLFGIWVCMETFVTTEARFLRWGAAVFSVAVIFGAAVVFKNLPNLEGTMKDFSKLELNLQSYEQNARYKVSKVTWEMFQDRKWIGWGAGSWRFVYPYYQMKYPDQLWAGKNRVIRDNANNDWFQYLSEVGIVGMLFMMPVLLYPYGWFLWNIRRVRMTHLVLLSTLTGLALHGFVETLMQNETILALSALVVVLLLKLPMDRARKTALPQVNEDEA